MKAKSSALLMSVIALASLSVSAQTYSGTQLDPANPPNLIYSTLGPPFPASDAQYVAGTPDVAHLFTADQGSSGDSPAVFVPGTFAGPLSTLTGSYATAAGTTVQPYWAIFVSTAYDPASSSPTDYEIYSVNGGPLTQSSQVHGFDASYNPVGTFGETLSALEAGLGIGGDVLDYVGLEIGAGGSDPLPAGTANISSITISSPAIVTPDGASTFLLLGLGFAGLAVFGFKQNHLLMAK
jgi:hypothetical protein